MILPIITMIVFTLGQQLGAVEQNVVDRNFALIEDFEKNQQTFRRDTFDLVGHSDGGQLVAYHKRDPTYLVFDIWLFGETGKIHATYWTDRDINFKIVKRTDFKYDKPYYEIDYKVTETAEYLSYTDKSVIRYNSDKREIKDSLADKKKIESEDFFKAITKDLKIVN